MNAGFNADVMHVVSPVFTPLQHPIRWKQLWTGSMDAPTLSVCGAQGYAPAFLAAHELGCPYQGIVR